MCSRNGGQADPLAEEEEIEVRPSHDVPDALWSQLQMLAGV